MKKNLCTLLLLALGLTACDPMPQPEIKLSVSESVAYCQLSFDGSGSAIASTTLRVLCSRPWTLSKEDWMETSVYSSTGTQDITISIDTETFGTPEYGAFIGTLVLTSEWNICEIPLYYFHPLTRDDFNGFLFTDFCFDNFDKDKDDCLSLEEVMAVTTINVNNLGLTLMEGIGYFKNLRELHCTHNGLEVLDLTGLINLQLLDCSNNDLTELDLIGLNSLKTVECNNNHLRELDVSATPNLAILQCGNNNTALTVWVNSSTVLGEGPGQLAVWPYTSSTPITIKGEVGTTKYVRVEDKVI